jgi:hypothetical protein
MSAPIASPAELSDTDLDAAASAAGVDRAQLDALTPAGRAAAAELFLQLAHMSDEDLRRTVGVWVLNEAIVPTAAGDMRLTGLLNEGRRRLLAEGRDEWCGVHSLYSRGWDDAYRSQGHRPSKAVCRCPGPLEQ